VVPAVRDPLYVKIAVLRPNHDMVPETGVPPAASVNVAPAITVKGLTISEKVTEIVVVVPTFVAPLVGLVDATVGGVVSMIGFAPPPNVGPL
jgi:hypothetical protein